MTTTPVSQREQIRKAAASERDEIASTLAAAFFDDPVFGWLIPDAARRHATLRPFFELSTATFLTHDEIYVNNDLTGTVVWGPPTNPTGIEDEEEYQSRTEQIVADVDVPRLNEIIALLEEHHPRRPHLFLQWAAVVPDRQGQGTGSALLTHALQRCDRDRLPAYTEATNLRNRKLYERHGFTFLSAVAPATCPPLYRMWREPAAC